MSDVAVWKQQNAVYPLDPPFHPSEQFPELVLSGVDKSNLVYDSVRQLFRLLKYDEDKFETAEWNPLGWLVRPGQTVLIKPNMVRQEKLDNSGEWVQVITHGSVVRAVIDFVYIALKGRGRIQVADLRRAIRIWSCCGSALASMPFKVLIANSYSLKLSSSTCGMSAGKT